MVAGTGLGNVVVVAPDIGVWEVLGSLVLLLEVQVPGASLPVLPMRIHLFFLEGPKEWVRCCSESACWMP